LPDYPIPPFGESCPQVYGSLVQQTRQALEQAGFSEALIGLSGGIDSALVATLAVAALGAGRVHGLLMPAAVSSAGSVIDACELADRLGIIPITIPIEPVFAAFKEALAPAFSGTSEDVTEENLQARIRGTMLMALSNKRGWFVLNTGNLSESLMGYGTLHGDMVGSFAPLGGLLKTQVYELARYANDSAREEEREEESGAARDGDGAQEEALRAVRDAAPGQGEEDERADQHARDRRPPIPEAILDKEPSAELAPEQFDRDDLGPYDEIDPILYGRFVRGRSAEQLIEEGAPPDLLRRVLDQAARAAFKLRYEPPAAQVTAQVVLLAQAAQGSAASQPQPLATQSQEQQPQPQVGLPQVPQPQPQPDSADEGEASSR